jgi:hypothetical protein
MNALSRYAGQALVSLTMVLATATTAQAGLMNTEVTVDFGSGSGGCLLTETVVRGYEWVDAGPALCMAGPSGRLDIDVGDDYWRIDFTTVQDFGTGTGTDVPLFTLNNLAPICWDGSVGSIRDLTSVTTNMNPNDWIPEDIEFGRDFIRILGNPVGDQNVRTNTGDFIDVQIEFECPPNLPPKMDFNGTCPGVLTLDGKGFTAGGSVAVLKGNGLGNDAMPAGPCTGGVTDLSGLSYVTSISADADGKFALSPNISANLCGASIQMVDLTTCQLSNVDEL